MSNAPSSRLERFLAELKRRRVFRVAAAYLVGAWVVVEVATQTFPFLGLPDRLVTLVIVLAAVGFPIAIILAWMFDVERTARDGDTEDREPEESRLRNVAPYVGVGILIAIAVLGTATVVIGPAEPEADETEAAEGEVGPPPDPLADFAGRRHALLIGIATRSPADADATALYNFLRSPAAVGGIAARNATLLVNEQATADRIRAALQELVERSSPEDVVFLFIAGSVVPTLPGHPDAGRAYLVADDFDPIAAYGGEGPVRLDSMPGVVPLDTISRALDAMAGRQVIVFADATRLLVRSSNDSTVIAPPLNLLATGRRTDRGFVFLNAGELGQASQVGKWWEGSHGVFAFYVLRGLKGAADADGDRVVSLDELIEYTRREVRELTDGEQVPSAALTRFDGSWPMAVVPPGGPELGPEPVPFQAVATEGVIDWPAAHDADDHYRAVLDSVADATDLQASEHFDRGIRAFNTEAYDRSAAHFRASAALQPCSRDAWLNLVQALYLWSTELDSGAAVQAGDSAMSPVRALRRELVLAAQRVLELDPYNRNAMSFVMRTARQIDEMEVATRMFEHYGSIPVEITEVHVSDGSPPQITGALENLALTAGDTVRVRFTLFDDACRGVGSTVIATAAPGREERTEFSGTIEVTGRPAGWRYELLEADVEP